VRFGTCEVRDAATGAVVSGSSCTVTDLRVGSVWEPTGNRQTDMYAKTTSTQGNEQYLVLSLNLADTRDLPADWAWATSGVGDPQGQLRPPAGYACSNLPALTGQTPTGWAAGAQTFYFLLFENRAGRSGLSCS